MINGSTFTSVDLYITSFSKQKLYITMIIFIYQTCGKLKSLLAIKSINGNLYFGIKILRFKYRITFSSNEI